MSPSILQVVLAGASAFFLALAIHPFTTYPLSLYCLRSFNRRFSDAGERELRTALRENASEPTFAICMSVYNEESCIEDKIANLFAVAGTVQRCSLHIYADAPSDRTVEILQAYADRIDLVVGEERRGKTHGLNALMRRVKAEVVMFTDANVTIEPGALNRIGRHFADPEVGCVCGNLVYVNGDETPTSASGAVYWRIEEAIKALESDTYSVIGADGSLFAVRRACHHAPPDDIIDDFYVSMMILCDGYRVVREPQALAFERSVTVAGDEFNRKVRIACQAFNVHRLIWPRIRGDVRLAYYYLSHRFLKWLTIYNLAIGTTLLLCTLAIAFSAQSITLLAAGLGLTIAALAAAGWKRAQQGFSMLLSCTGVGIGIWHSICGYRYQVWQPSLSARGTMAD